jgi:hypothetical protein
MTCPVCFDEECPDCGGCLGCVCMCCRWCGRDDCDGTGNCLADGPPEDVGDEEPLPPGLAALAGLLEQRRRDGYHALESGEDR